VKLCQKIYSDNGLKAPHVREEYLAGKTPEPAVVFKNERGKNKKNKDNNASDSTPKNQKEGLGEKTGR
jgi:hypothetical protein